MALNPVPSSPPPPQSETNQSAAENWCFTQFKVIKSSFMWAIDSFSHGPEEMGAVLNSSTFSTGSNGKSKWCLRLYPNGLDEESVNHLSLFLVSHNETEVRAKFEFSILNVRKEKTEAIGIPQAHTFPKGKNWGFKKFIRRDHLLDSDLLPDDKLTLYCEIGVAEYSINMSGQNSVTQFKVPECHISADFGKLFHGQKFTDFILSVNGREFAAHKAILAARSPVFYAMFEHDTEEKKQSRVEITDMDHEVLREMLHYIYTGKVSNIENKPRDLLAAADKYALDRLKVMCEEHIRSNLSISRAAADLILADMHSADQLKVHVIDFINMHGTDVMDTAEWRTMIQTHPHLVDETLRVLIAQQIPPTEPPRKRTKQ